MKATMNGLFAQDGNFVHICRGHSSQCKSKEWNPWVSFLRRKLSKTHKQRSDREYDANRANKQVYGLREMMKNVQGSSAGAGSGEFHVYKASRRREYERLKMMEDEAQKVQCMPFTRTYV